MIYHLTDNSARFTTGWTGWTPAWADKHIGICKQYDVGLCVRQPIPTASIMPLHIDGWIQTEGRAALWHEGFISAIDRVERETGKPPILYVGHAGGDRQDWSDRRDVTDRPYAPAPTLDEDLGHDANRFIDTFNRCVSPYLRAGNNRSWLYIDGSAMLQADSPYFAYIDMLRRVMAAYGRVVGIESPPPHDYAHLKPFPVGATYGSFVNRLRDNPSDKWLDYPEPRIVFVTSGLPPGLVASGDIGGWSEDMHREMVRRVLEVEENGGNSIIPLAPVQRGGFNSIEAWITEYS